MNQMPYTVKDMNQIYTNPSENQEINKKSLLYNAFYPSTHKAYAAIEFINNKHVCDPTDKEKYIVSRLIVSLYHHGADFKPRNKKLAEWFSVHQKTITRIKEKYWDKLFKIERRFDPTTGLELSSYIRPVKYLFDKEFLLQVAKVFSLPFWLLSNPLPLYSLQSLIQIDNVSPVLKYNNNNTTERIDFGCLSVEAVACSLTALSDKSKQPNKKIDFASWCMLIGERPLNDAQGTTKHNFEERAHAREALQKGIEMIKEVPEKGSERIGQQNDAHESFLEILEIQEVLEVQKLKERLKRAQRNVKLTTDSYNQRPTPLNKRWLEQAERDLEKIENKLAELRI